MAFKCRTEELEAVSSEPVSKIRLASNVQRLPVKESVQIVEPTSVEVRFSDFLDNCFGAYVYLIRAYRVKLL